MIFPSWKSAKYKVISDLQKVFNLSSQKSYFKRKDSYLYNMLF